jgi:hypothetical protein
MRRLIRTTMVQQKKKGCSIRTPRFNYFPLKKINGDFAPLHDYFFFAFFFAFFLVAMCD